MNILPELDKALKSLPSKSDPEELLRLLKYAEYQSCIENVVAVVSDLAKGTSRIFPGKFGARLGIGNYDGENSIWEKEILKLMEPGEREEKFLAELRFFNYLRHIPPQMRPNYHLISRLRFRTVAGESIEVLHRMYYVYLHDSGTVSYALCLYGMPTFDLSGKSLVMNSLTGISEELTSKGDAAILSNREKQVLKLIESGMTSARIADILSISRHTVSRHRQEILNKLQVKNSIEACRIAKSMKII